MILVEHICKHTHNQDFSSSSIHRFNKKDRYKGEGGGLPKTRPIGYTKTYTQSVCVCVCVCFEGEEDSLFVTMIRNTRVW